MGSIPVRVTKTPAFVKRQALFLVSRAVWVESTGIEQLVPAVLRPGRQKRPCGAFLERGRFPVRVTKTPAFVKRQAFFLYHALCKFKKHKTTFSLQNWRCGGRERPPYNARQMLCKRWRNIFFDSLSRGHKPPAVLMWTFQFFCLASSSATFCW